MKALGKRKRGNDDDDSGSSPGVDRLSALPDHLLHEIMSRMKALQMMQTCRLSRRWRHLWPKVPCLDIDEREFVNTGSDQKFIDFVFFLLLQNKVSVADLDSFRLHVHAVHYDSSVTDVSASIRRAIMSSAMSSGTWRLKRLYLSNLRLDGLFAEHVRSRCPFLEHLELSQCGCGFHAITSGSLKCLALRYCVGKGFSEITSPTLKNLVIENGRNEDLTSPFVVAAPALACLFLVVTPYNFPGGVSFGEMASLAKASIHLKLRETITRKEQLRGHLFKTLCSMSNATSLELSGFDVVLGEESMAFPEFKNLRSLELKECGGNERQVSGHIIRNSPNLEKLTLSQPCWQVLVAGSLPYPEFKNMRVLILDKYDPIDDSETLGHFLRILPMLEKLTLRCSCKKNEKKRRGTSKQKNAVQNLVDFQCENLKLTEIIYKDEDVVQLSELTEFLLRFSRNLPNNNIRPTKVD